MTDLFISYKREDEIRVGRLVEALQKEGLSVWWDRGLPGGESWRTNIQNALDAAKCAIVVWTENSIGPAGDFVRDEAGQAKARGILVPVMLEKVRQPLGFGEVQAIDLTSWRGNPRDPFFRDVVNAVRAKLEGKPVPPPSGPIERVKAWLRTGGIVGALLAVAGSVWAFYGNAGLQGEVCQIPIFQPALSDGCGAWNLGNRPKRDERLSWESLKTKPGDCDAVRGFISRYPRGRLLVSAKGVLEAAGHSQTVTWTQGERLLNIYQGKDAPASASEAAAKAAALVRAQSGAERQCRDFAATSEFKFVEAVTQAEQWSCDHVAGGIVCGFEGRAHCQLQEHVVTEHETCTGGGK